MRKHFATPASGKEDLIKCGVKNYLCSQFNKAEVKPMLNIAQHIEKPNLIVDSGAFSAWASGRPISLPSYITFIEGFRKEHRDKFGELYFVNLDVIPGKQGQLHITHEENMEAAREGWRNYQKLKKIVPDVIHVYHEGEPEAVLKALLNDGAKYIGVSPSNDSSTVQRQVWLDETFTKIPNDIKTHGFAVTSPRLMARYNWYSVDSISYYMNTAMGGFTVNFKGGKYDGVKYQHSERSSDIVMGTKNAELIQEHLFNLDTEFDLEKVKYSHRLRARINIHYFLHLQKIINEAGVSDEYCSQQTFFDKF